MIVKNLGSDSNLTSLPCKPGTKQPQGQRIQSEISFIFMHLFCQSKAIFSKILDKFLGGYKRWFSNPSLQLASRSKLWSFSSLHCGLGQVFYVLEKNHKQPESNWCPLCSTFCLPGSQLLTWVNRNTSRKPRRKIAAV